MYLKKRPILNQTISGLLLDIEISVVQIPSINNVEIFFLVHYLGYWFLITWANVIKKYNLYYPKLQ